MDPSPVQTAPSVEEDEWDTDGFVIPSLGIGDSGQNKSDSIEVEDSSILVKDHSYPGSCSTAFSSPCRNITLVDKKEEYIYLGPHGAPPSHSKQQELNFSNRKQRFKQKLKDADRKFGGTGREDKVGHLRELVGGKMPVNPSKSSPREWLDPHCHESQFEKRRP